VPPPYAIGVIEAAQVDLAALGSVSRQRIARRYDAPGENPQP
jgi:hypothetical protein